jgi:hypothetical protein
MDNQSKKPQPATTRKSRGRKIGFAGYERPLSGGMEPALPHQAGAVDLPFKAARSAATQYRSVGYPSLVEAYYVARTSRRLLWAHAEWLQWALNSSG